MHDFGGPNESATHPIRAGVGYSRRADERTDHPLVSVSDVWVPAHPGVVRILSRMWIAVAMAETERKVNVKIYVASSWRNEFQPIVCAEFREDGHEVYDFRHPEPGNNGFSWSAIDPDWHSRQVTPDRYMQLLAHPIAEKGYTLDMAALTGADVCVMVMPCGLSAGVEFGYARGAGKPTAVYVPALRDPDLMVKMADFITTDIVKLCNWVNSRKKR